MTNDFILLSLISFFIVYSSKYLAKWFGLYDKKTSRKNHTSKATFLGGVCLSVYLLVILKLHKYHPLIDNLIIFSILISLIGFIDDKVSLSPGLRLISISIVIIYLATAGFEINYLGSFFDISLTLGKFSLLFTIGAVLATINSYNYSDGIDGLASSLFITSIISICIILHLFKLEQIIFIHHILLFLVILLFFNFGIVLKEKTFLGNSGSYLIGFLHSYILIFLHISKEVSPIILAWTLGFIFYEFVSTNIIRIKNKVSPLVAGKDHLHYILKDIFKKNFIVLIIINSVNLFLISFGFLSYYFLNESYSIILFILSGLLYFFVRNKISSIGFKQ